RLRKGTTGGNTSGADKEFWGKVLKTSLTASQLEASTKLYSQVSDREEDDGTIQQFQVPRATASRRIRHNARVGIRHVDSRCNRDKKRNQDGVGSRIPPLRLRGTIPK